MIILLCCIISLFFFFTLKQLFTLALVVSGGHLPESLRGSEKLLNNQWY